MAFCSSNWSLVDVERDQEGTDQRNEWQEVEPDRYLEHSEYLVNRAQHHANWTSFGKRLNQVDRLVFHLGHGVVLEQVAISLDCIAATRSCDHVEIFKGRVLDDVFVVILAQRLEESIIELGDDCEGHEIHDDIEVALTREDDDEVHTFNEDDAQSLQEACQVCDPGVFKPVVMVKSKLHDV